MKHSALPKWAMLHGYRVSMAWQHWYSKTAVNERHHQNFKALFACLIVAVLKTDMYEPSDFNPAKYDSLFMKYISTLPFLHRGLFESFWYYSSVQLKLRNPSWIQQPLPLAVMRYAKEILHWEPQASCKSQSNYLCCCKGTATAKPR